MCLGFLEAMRFHNNWTFYMTAQDLTMSAPAKNTSDITQHHFWYTHWSNQPLDARSQHRDLSRKGMPNKKGGGVYFKSS